MSTSNGLSASDFSDKKTSCKIGFLLIPRFNMMSLTMTLEPMRIANYLLPDTFYQWDYLSLDENKITASNGMAVDCMIVSDDDSSYDMIFVFGSWGCERSGHEKICHWLRKQERHGIPLCAMELAIYIFAHAGLLQGKSVTTHWCLMAGFLEQFPDLHVTEQLFTIDKNIMSCAGGTAGMDLMLHIIGSQHGSHLVSEVSDQILHHKRPFETLQRHTLGSITGFVHPDIKSAIRIIQNNISEPLTVPQIADGVGISQRQLERYCNRYMNCSIVQLSQILRLQYARSLLVSTRMSILEAAIASGFNSMSHFSQMFRKYFGKKPSQYRMAWPERETNPSWPGTLFAATSRLKANAEKFTKSTAE